MPSFPESNPIFDNAPHFKRPPDDHPYWTNEYFLKQEYGFSREFLVMLAEIDQAQDGRITKRLDQAINTIKRMCEHAQSEHEPASGIRMQYEPEYIANALMRKLTDFTVTVGGKFNEAQNLLEYLISADDDGYDQFDFDRELRQAYHPNNRPIMPFQAGVRADGTIIDAPGPASQHPRFVDERGKLLDLYFD